MIAGVHTRASLADDLRALGVRVGATVMAHTAFRSVGPVVGGPDALIDALLDTVGADGTVVSYQDWEVGADVWGDDGSVTEELRAHMPAFDPTTARAARTHGIFASTFGTRQGVRKSVNPGACIAALGSRATELTDGHPLDYGYGAGSPLERLTMVGGQVIMIGAPLDTMTLLHHAEHRADLPGKRRVRIEYPLVGAEGEKTWRWIEEFDTSRPVVEGLPDDYFATVVADYLAQGSGSKGLIGGATAVLVDAEAVTAFAVAWLETWTARRG
jgi:aminoglycoside 3-N-acetyltransferase